MAVGMELSMIISLGTCKFVIPCSDLGRRGFMEASRGTGTWNFIGSKYVVERSTGI